LPGYGGITGAQAINDVGVFLGGIDISYGGGCYEPFTATSPFTITPQDQTVRTIPGFRCADGFKINNLNQFTGDLYNAFTGPNRRAFPTHRRGIPIFTIHRWLRTVTGEASTMQGKWSVIMCQWRNSSTGAA
jgi:hypothetical protein